MAQVHQAVAVVGQGGAVPGGAGSGYDLVHFAAALCLRRHMQGDAVLAAGSLAVLQSRCLHRALDCGGEARRAPRTQGGSGCDWTSRPRDGSTASGGIPRDAMIILAVPRRSTSWPLMPLSAPPEPRSISRFSMPKIASRRRLTVCRACRVSFAAGAPDAPACVAVDKSWPHDKFVAQEPRSGCIEGLCGSVRLLRCS